MPSGARSIVSFIIVEEIAELRLQLALHQLADGVGQRDFAAQQAVYLQRNRHRDVVALGQPRQYARRVYAFGRAAFALVPSSMPSQIPAAIAITFFRVPPSSVPTGSVLT